MNLHDIRNRFKAAERDLLPSGHPRFLFRGQSRTHESLNTTIGRLYAADPLAANQAHMLYRHAQQLATAMEGYTVQKLDAIALLQHYGWPTPILDVTSSLEVAIWFALFDATPSHECVIYVIDLAKIPDELIVFQNRKDEIMASWQIPDAAKKLLVLDHFFLTHPLASGGSKHRWLRQAGFALTTGDFTSLDSGQAFDLGGF